MAEEKTKTAAATASEQGTIALAEESAKRKKSGSRKGKKNWRKNVDIADVEENLAELVVEEVAGGKIHERKNEDLFTTDVAGSANVAKRMKNEKKKLRVDQILEQRSHVKAPIERTVIKENISSKADTRRVDTMVKRLASGELKRETRGDRRRKRVRAEGQRIAEFDLWDEGGVTKVKEIVPSLIDETATPTPITTQKPATIGRNRVQQDAVKISHPGASYRPTEKDHLELLDERQQVIRRRQRQHKELNSELSYPKEWDDEEDTLEGKPDDEAAEAEEEEEDNGTDDRKQPTRKTKAQRNREKRLRGQEALAAEQRRKKKLMKELGRLPMIKREVEAEEKERNERIEERMKQREIEATQPIKKLGKRSIPETLATAQQAEDLTDSLRRLKTEGNLLRERYHSMLERNIIEPRVKVGKRRKYKLKKYEKPSYRDFA